MIGLASTLTLLLATQDPTPSTTCELTDNACKARQFIAKAAKAPPPQRARYLFTAHRSYIALFASTGEMRHLCAARSNFDRSLAITGQSDQQRASFEKSRTELEALEKQHGATCSTPRKRKTPPPKLAQTTAPAPLLTPEPTTQTPADPAPPPPNAVLTAPVDHAVPLRPIPMPAPTAVTTRRRDVLGRSLAIAGGATLGLGVVSTGFAGFAGSRVSDASDRAYSNYQDLRGMGSPDGHAMQDKLRREYDRWLGITVGTAVAGTTAMIVGAVLVSLGIRKLRDPTRVAVLPAPGGLAIHARF